MFYNLWLVLALLSSVVSALQVELIARENPEPVCIRDFVGQNQLVVVNVKTDGFQGDGQKLQMTVYDTLGNQFHKKNDISKDVRVSFTTHEAAAIDICLTNFLDRNKKQRTYLSRHVELDVESGASARDWNVMQTEEKLRPAELELKKIEEMTREIADELTYLKVREERMRDTNESTNSRVKWFSVLIILLLVGLGVWQIQYLRHYFKVKHII